MKTSGLFLVIAAALARPCMVGAVSSGEGSSSGGTGGADVYQRVRVEVYRLCREDSVFVLDMNIDLGEVRLGPDCTVYLFPCLTDGQDSLRFSPVMLNGPQSDLMYRRRRALKEYIAPDRQHPYVVLRQGEHPFPRVNYRTRVSYSKWMESARLALRDESMNCDSWLKPFVTDIGQLPRDTVVIRDTVVVQKVRIERDTVYAAAANTAGSHAYPVPPAAGEENKRNPVYTLPAKIREKDEKSLAMPESFNAPRKLLARILSGEPVSLYFPSGESGLQPGSEANRKGWAAFVGALDSLCRASGRHRIDVTGYSSPDGNWQDNEQLARKRAEALKTYITGYCRESRIEVSTAWEAESWKELSRLIETSSMAGKDRVAGFIRNVGIFSGREMRIREMDNGKTWKYLSDTYFPALRRVEIRIKANGHDVSKSKTNKEKTNEAKKK